MLHKNIPNNNKDIIRFLAKNFAGTKKVRNMILFCSIIIGIVMLLYSIGHSALVMVAGTSVGFVQRISGNTRYNKAETVLKVIMGTAILLIGFYMFWLAF